MDEKIRDKIINAGVPIEIYQTGYVDLGPNNRSALKRLAAIANLINKNKLPLPPSPFIEYVVEQISGSDKQDFRTSIDGKKPGDGKSYSLLFLLEWYAILKAEKHGQDPKDYFSLDNCALLDDAEGIMQLLDEADKEQAILIDDAGAAMNAKEHQTQRVRSLNKIFMTCRTKRWFLGLSSPLLTDIDLKTRELMYVKTMVYKPFHDLGFNILKKHIIDTHVYRNKKFYNERRISFHGKKYDFWVAFSPDYFDVFKGYAEAYDKRRETASNKLIHDERGKETDRKDTRSQRERNKEKLYDQWYPTIQMMLTEKSSKRQITAETGLSDHMINVLIAKGKQEQVNK